MGNMGRRGLGIAVLATVLFLPFQNCGKLESLKPDLAIANSEDSDLIPDTESEQPTSPLPSDPPYTPPPSSPTAAGYDIIIVAGESNAAGRGAGTYSDSFSTSARNAKILQLGRYGAADHQPIPATDILEHWHTRDQDGNLLVGVGMGAAFARRYVDSHLASHRKVLIIPAALGSAASFSWDNNFNSAPLNPDFTDSTMLLDDLKSRVIAAKALPAGTHRVVAMLWHQGESDVSCLDVTSWCHDLTSNEAAYLQRLKSITTALRNTAGTNFPLIIGKFAPSWVQDAGSGPHAQVLENGFDLVSAYITKSGTVSTEGLQSNSQAVHGSSDKIHFSAQSQIDLGARYHAVFKNLSP